jgi:hypothetical protein
MSLSRRHQLTWSDANWVDVAIRGDLPLVTADLRLIASVPDEVAILVDVIASAADGASPTHAVATAGDELGFHVIEADSIEVVARVTEMAGIEVERIVEAVSVGPGRVGDDAMEGTR